MDKYLCCLPAINRKKRNNTCLGNMAVKCLWKYTTKYNTHEFSNCHTWHHTPFTHIFIFKKHVFGAFHSHIRPLSLPIIDTTSKHLDIGVLLLMLILLFLFEPTIGAVYWHDESPQCSAMHMYAVKIMKYLYMKYYRSVLTISWKCPLWRTKCTLVFWQVWVRSSRLNLTFEWERTLMTEQIEHVIKTRLNHLFISCHKKKEKKIWWREKTQCLMHLRTTSVCHLISEHWWHLRHSQLCIHYWSTTVNHCFVVVLSIHLPPVPFAVFMCYCWIRTTSWTELVFAWQIICQHHPISTINLQTVYGREYWGHIACLCFKTAGTFRHSIKCVWWKNCLKCPQMVYLICPDSRLNAFKWVLAKCNER